MNRRALRAIAALTAALVVITAAGCAGKSADKGAAGNNNGKESEASGQTEGKVMTRAEFDSAKTGERVTVETYVQAKQIWWDGAASFYTQNEEGGYFIYSMKCGEDEYERLTKGTKLKISGIKNEWAGGIQITEATFVTEEGSFEAIPTDVTGMNEDELAQHMNELAEFKGMKIEPSTGKDGTERAFLYNSDGGGTDGASLYFKASKDGRIYTFTVESFLTDATSEVYNKVKKLKIGDIVDLTGFLYRNNKSCAHIIGVDNSAE